MRFALNMILLCALTLPFVARAEKAVTQTDLSSTAIPAEWSNPDSFAQRDREHVRDLVNSLLGDEKTSKEKPIETSPSTNR